MTFTLEVTRVPRHNPLWREQASCLFSPEPDIFFTPQFYGEAKEICAQCPVTDECLAEGIRQDGENNHGGIHGIWGGLTPEERINLKRRQKRKEVA